MTKITQEQKNQILQNLASKGEWSAINEAMSLIDKINTAANEREWGENHPNLLTDEKLEVIQDPISGSNLQKAIQALRDNGFGLNLSELINHEQKKREEQSKKRGEKNIHQAIVDVDRVEMDHFMPQENLGLSNNSNFGINQAIVGAKGLKMKNFKPQRGEKINAKQEKTQKVAKKDLISQINQLSNKINLTSEELAFINKIKELIQKKNNFLRARQETIQELQKCCDILESTLIKGKYAQNDERTNLLTTVGKVAGCWTFNLIEATGQVANLTNAHFQRLFTIKQGEQFQISLRDEPEIQVMEQTYQELLTIIKKEVGLFSAKYKIYEVATNLWTNKAHIDVSDMKDAISLLTERLNLLNEEVKEQAKALQQLDSNFALNNPEPSSLQEQEKQSKTEVQRLQTELDNLTDNAKEKLQSKSRFNKEKITREREKLLQKYLINSLALTKEESKDLEKKLSKELLNKLITTQQRLTELNQNKVTEQASVMQS
jgi:hypothetical protein